MSEPDATRRAGWRVTGPQGCEVVDFGRDVHALLGVPFDLLSLEEATQRVRAACLARQPMFFSTPNVNFVVTACRDAAFRQSVLASDLSVVDGMPLVWLARWMGIPLKERVAGADLFELLRLTPSPRPLRVYFFGGPQGVAEAASARVGGPGRSTVGVGGQSPGFHPLDVLSSLDRLDAINRAQPDLLLVALGALKGQAWIMRNRAALNGAPVLSHLGAVVNFVAGTVRRAPSWVSRTGLEWLWRIFQEPSLWRRYVGDAWSMVGLVRRFVWPVRLYQQSAIRRGGEAPDGRWTVSAAGAAVTLDLEGDWRPPHTDALRDALSAAARMDGDLTVHLGHGVILDARGFGLLLLLQGWCRQVGHRLDVVAEDGDLAQALAAQGLGADLPFRRA